MYQGLRFTEASWQMEHSTLWETEALSFMLLEQELLKTLSILKLPRWTANVSMNVCSFLGPFIWDQKSLGEYVRQTPTAATGSKKHKHKKQQAWVVDHLHANEKVNERGTSFWSISTINLSCALTLSSPALLSIANFTQSGVILHAKMVLRHWRRWPLSLSGARCCDRQKRVSWVRCDGLG